MVRFILVCMAIVATTAIATSAQFITDGIGNARDAVMARNAAPAVQDADLSAPQSSGPSFEEIYANAPAPSMDAMSPEQLNAIATAAGGDDFSTDTFTNTAPMGLEDTPAPAPMMETVIVEEGEAN